MSSAKKIAANQINGRKSRGPRSKEGKAAASRNAFRHGLSTISYRNPAFAPEIEERAKALCEGETNPDLFHHALRVAEYDLILRQVRRERVALIERCRDGTVVAHSERNNGLALAKRRWLITELAFAELKRMGATFDGDVIIPEHFFKEEDDDEPRVYAPLVPPIRDRTHVEAFLEAMPDLKKLDRYERRALSARNRAMRDFLGMLPLGEADENAVGESAPTDTTTEAETKSLEQQAA
jgi:hypothetical protein